MVGQIFRCFSEMFQSCTRARSYCGPLQTTFWNISWKWRHQRSSFPSPTFRLVLRTYIQVTPTDLHTYIQVTPTHLHSGYTYIPTFRLHLHTYFLLMCNLLVAMKEHHTIIKHVLQAKPCTLHGYQNDARRGIMTPKKEGGGGWVTYTVYLSKAVDLTSVVTPN